MDPNIKRPINSPPHIRGHLRLMPTDKGKAAQEDWRQGHATLLSTNDSDRNASRPPTVFVVGNNQQIEEATALLRNFSDIQVETFESAKTFLGTFDPSRPGCIVLDVDMTGASGLDLLHLLIFRGVRIPLLLLAADEGSVENDVIQAKTVDLLEKPFCAQAFFDWVMQALHRS